jgi:hypothetical protein
MFDSYRKEIRAQCLHPPAHLGLHLIVMSEVLSFKTLLQMSTELEIARCKKWAEWWMGKTFPPHCREDVVDVTLEYRGNYLSLPGPTCNNEGQHFRHDNKVKAEMHWWVQTESPKLLFSAGVQQVMYQWENSSFALEIMWRHRG